MYHTIQAVNNNDGNAQSDLQLCVQMFSSEEAHMSLDVRKTGFPTRSDTNRAVQS